MSVIKKIFFVKYNKLVFLLLVHLIMLTPVCIFSASVQQDSIRDICHFLGGRADKNFLGSGNVAMVVEPNKAKVLFVQKWKDQGLFDWASGTVRSWFPDRMEMKEAMPPMGTTTTHIPVSRSIFITRDDVLGMNLLWENTDSKDISVKITFTGKLLGNAQIDTSNGSSFISSSAPYSDKVSHAIHYVLASSLAMSNTELDGANYTISYDISVKAGEQKTLSILLGSGTDMEITKQAVKNWKDQSNILDAVRLDWNSWFDQEIPSFECSNPYFEKLYYYRWWSLYTKMIFAQLGHFYYPSPREGTVAYEGVVSYSGSCISVDELRWMRNPNWAFSTTKEFFAPENLNDGYLSNHIWTWGIDEDISNMDALGRSFPYQNYAIDAFRNAMLVHPEEGKQVLATVWPQMLTNLQSYQKFFDIDKDGLYETYPWSNTAGQEWTIRYSYFDPIPELLRNERGRTYVPDGTMAIEDMALVNKIKEAVVTDTNLHWPETSEELYRMYYGTLDHRLATVDQTTYAYRNFSAASSLAKLLNDIVSENHYANLSEQAKTQLLSVLWDKEDTYFYDAKPITQQLAKVKATTGFYPFWAGLAEEKHLPMLDYLFDPDVFFTNYPVPSLPLDYKKYDELQDAGWTYWNYYTWPRTTCHVVDGALWAAKTLDGNLTTKAATLFDRYTRMHFPNDDVKLPNIAERYDPHTGFPFMGYLDYNHSSWIDLLMKHVVGITPQDSEDIVIDPIDMGWKSFSMKNIKYRNHNISIDYSRAAGMTVTIDGLVRAQTPTLKKGVVKL